MLPSPARVSSRHNKQTAQQQPQPLISASHLPSSRPCLSSPSSPLRLCVCVPRACLYDSLDRSPVAEKKQRPRQCQQPSIPAERTARATQLSILSAAVAQCTQREHVGSSLLSSLPLLACLQSLWKKPSPGQPTLSATSAQRLPPLPAPRLTFAMYCPLVLFPPPGFRSRSLLKGAAGVAALPPFHFFPSLPANAATAAAASASSPFPSAPAQPSVSPSSSDASISPPSLQYPYADGSESGLSSSSSSSAQPPQLYSFSPLSSPRSGFTSPSLSPGPNIRRLAEQFLNSLPDDSPANHSRSIGRGQSSRAGPASAAPSPSAADAAAPQAGDSGRASDRAETAEAETETDVSGAASAGDMRVTELAADDASAWQQLHEELLAFARFCSADAAAQHRLRQDLVARTRWSIRAVWPQAEVDLVGSVAAGVALPKSDLDFVVWFEKSSAPPKAFAYTTGTGPASLPQLPYAIAEAGGAAGAETAGASAASAAEREKDLTKSPAICAVAAASPLSTTSTISVSSTSSSSSSVSSPASSTSSLSSSQRAYQYFAHAGALIKLIGGRKKSKLLFRSTKIQVFKDINLIRLRDGCSGVSMDLWFPADAAHLCRSQRHTQLLQSVAADWPHFTVLAFVVKSFMQQHLLNSGYSGLGSYGVLLMIIRFMQMERQSSSGRHGEGGAGLQQAASNAANAEAAGEAGQHQGKEAEENVGRELCRFFRFWAQFDYVTLGVDVRGDGAFIEKPVVVLDSSTKTKFVTTRRQLQQLQQQHDQRGAGDVDVADDDADGADEYDDRQPFSSYSSSAPRRVSRRLATASVADRLSLVITDPCDSSNHIVCHHKALRNLIQAYSTACRILDPLSPPPQPALEVQAVAALSDIEAVSLSSVPASASSSATPSVSSSAVGSTATTAPTTPITTAPPSAGATPPLTASTSPSLSAAEPPASVDGFSSTAASRRPNKSRFHRLIDINLASVGPKMKRCPSPLCVQPDGSSTQCPVQNKNCFACGHVFTRGIDGQKTGYKNRDKSATQQDGRPAGAGAGRGRGRAGKNAQKAQQQQQQQAQSLASQSRLRSAAPASSRSGQPLNKMTANGLIANTNGMKFVSPPPPSASAQQPKPQPMLQALSPAAAAGGFVYVNSPSPSGPVPSASAPHPTPFSLSMPVTPFYPPSPPAYYQPAYDPSFAPYAAAYAPLPPSASGKRAGQYRQQRPTSGTGPVPAAASMQGGMGGAIPMPMPGSPAFAPMLPAYYPDPSQMQQPYLGPAAYYAAAPYYAAAG